MFGAPIGRRLLLITAAASAAVLALVPAAGASAHPVARSPCPSCGRNLVLNPGAESARGAGGDIRVRTPDWKQTGGFTATQYAWSSGDVSATTHGPRRRGKNYFYGGPASARSTGTQVRTVAAGGIRSGKVRYILSGWLGGFDGQNDHATLVLTFEKADGTVVGSVRLGPVTEAQRKGVSELLFRSVKGKVPSATRKLKIELIMVRASGSDNDGLADNLSLVLRFT
jgi:hypothetical protein